MPASDFAGVVRAVGANVTEFEVGDQVHGQRFAADGNGFLCTHVVLPASAPFVKMPPGLGFVDAAAAPMAYTTVYDALTHWGRLPFPSGGLGYTILVLGGSSGTGSLAVQLSRQMGCTVVATCSTPNVELVRSLGAEDVIDYKTQDVVARARALGPYAVILDCVGGTDLIPHLDELLLEDERTPDVGIYVTIVGDNPSRDSFTGAVTNYSNPVQALRTWRGLMQDVIPRWVPGRQWVVGKRYACINVNETKEKLRTYQMFLEQGGRVLIDQVFPFGQAREAYARVESGRARGKVVVDVGTGGQARARLSAEASRAGPSSSAAA